MPRVVDDEGVLVVFPLRRGRVYHTQPGASSTPVDGAHHAPGRV